MPTALAISSTRSGSFSSWSMPKWPVGILRPLALRCCVELGDLGRRRRRARRSPRRSCSRRRRASSGSRRAAGSCASCRAGRKSRSCRPPWRSLGWWVRLRRPVLAPLVGERPVSAELRLPGLQRRCSLVRSNSEARVMSKPRRDRSGRAGSGGRRRRGPRSAGPANGHPDQAVRPHRLVDVDRPRGMPFAPRRATVTCSGRTPRIASAPAAPGPRRRSRRAAR